MKLLNLNPNQITSIAESVCNIAFYYVEESDLVDEFLGEICAKNARSDWKITTESQNWIRAEIIAFLLSFEAMYRGQRVYKKRLLWGYKSDRRMEQFLLKEAARLGDELFASSTSPYNKLEIWDKRYTEPYRLVRLKEGFATARIRNYLETTWVHYPKETGLNFFLDKIMIACVDISSYRKSNSKHTLTDIPPSIYEIVCRFAPVFTKYILNKREKWSSIIIEDSIENNHPIRDSIFM